MKEKKFFRNCPICGNQCGYTTRQALWIANKENRPCNKCKRSFKQKWKEDLSEEEFSHRLDEYKQEKRIHVIGENNPMYNTSIYDVWIEKYGIDKAKDLIKDHKLETSKNNGRGMTGTTVYEVWREKYGTEIANEMWSERNLKCARKGKDNGMYGKPPPQGSGNGWSGWYKGWYFRSLLELSYMITVIEKNGWKWRTGETKDLRIRWVDYKGDDRTYHPDFLCEEKYLVEIKPKKLHESPTVKAKREATEKFCEENGYEYILTDVKSLDTKEIFDLYSCGDIIFTSRYETKMIRIIEERRLSSDR